MACRCSEPGIVARTGQSQRLVEARHSTGDFALADLKVRGDALVGEVAFDQPQQLELATQQLTSKLCVGKPMHPGGPCHNPQCVTLRLSASVHLA